MTTSARPQRLILASGSPRRKQFLEQASLKFEVMPADIDETPHPNEGAAAYVERLAREKAAAVAANAGSETLVLAADTTVVVDDAILAKPEDVADAKRMLRQLSGRSHQVLTAIAVDGAYRASQVVETEVHFRALTDENIAWYVATGEPTGKAGAYAIQGIGAMWVDRVRGSVTSVVGLPLTQTFDLLERAGLSLPWERVL